jgi:hypothetical protein
MVENGTETDGNRLYRFLFPHVLLESEIKTKTPETNTKAAITEDGYVTDTL